MAGTQGPTRRLLPAPTWQPSALWPANSNAQSTRTPGSWSSKDSRSGDGTQREMQGPPMDPSLLESREQAALLQRAAFSVPTLNHHTPLFHHLLSGISGPAAKEAARVQCRVTMLKTVAAWHTDPSPKRHIVSPGADLWPHPWGSPLWRCLWADRQTTWRRLGCGENF